MNKERYTEYCYVFIWFHSFLFGPNRRWGFAVFIDVKTAYLHDTNEFIAL